MKNYHVTCRKYLNNINRNGLKPNNGKNSQNVNDQEVKVCFSQGFEGTILTACNFYRKYTIEGYGDYENYINNYNCVLKFDKDKEELKDKEKEDISDSYITEDINTNELSIALLNDGNTNRKDILVYMMSKVSYEDICEKIRINGKRLDEFFPMKYLDDGDERKDRTYADCLKEFYDKYEEDINKMKDNKGIKLMYEPLEKYCEKHKEELKKLESNNLEER